MNLARSLLAIGSSGLPASCRACVLTVRCVLSRIMSPGVCGVRPSEESSSQKWSMLALFDWAHGAKWSGLAWSGAGVLVCTEGPSTEKRRQCALPAVVDRPAFWTRFHNIGSRFEQEWAARECWIFLPDCINTWFGPMNVQEVLLENKGIPENDRKSRLASAGPLPARAASMCSR